MNQIPQRERTTIGALSPNNERSAIRPSRKGWPCNRPRLSESRVSEKSDIWGNRSKSNVDPGRDRTRVHLCDPFRIGFFCYRLPQMSPDSAGLNLGLFYDNPCRDFQEYSKYFLTLRLIPLTAGQSWDCC